jgi:hypothetical protein
MYILNLQLCYSFILNIIKSPILTFLPKINEHYIVVLYNKNDKNNIYTIDFSPINKNSKTLIKLSFGQNISSIIRIKNFNYNNSLFSKDFINKWENEKNISFFYIKDKKIKDFLYKYYFINREMNLYNYNCKHFAEKIYYDYILMIKENCTKIKYINFQKYLLGKEYLFL